MPIVLALMLPVVAACGGDDADDGVPSDAAARVGETTIGKREVATLLPAEARQGNYRQQAARVLILAEWLERDAKRERVSIPSTTSAGGKAAATFASVAALTEALTEQAGGGAPPESEIAAYYRNHPNEYARPEVRYMRSVAAGSRAEAEKAKAALERGESWKAVIARHSTGDDSASPPSGDMGLQPGEFHEALGGAVYAARRGTFNGPVQTDQAWYVFKLTHVDRLPRQSLAKVRETIEIRLQANRDERARLALGKRLRDRYRPITTCSERVRVDLCHNGPALDAESVLSPGA